MISYLNDGRNQHHTRTGTKQQRTTLINPSGYKINNMEEELTSDCCGAFTTDTEMGICPDCLEHCEFTSEE